MQTTGRGETVPCAPIVVHRSDASIENVLIAVPHSGTDIEAVERALIVFALECMEGNRTRAARFLRLSRSALIYRMHKHGLTPADGAESDPCHRRQSS